MPIARIILPVFVASLSLSWVFPVRACPNCKAGVLAELSALEVARSLSASTPTTQPAAPGGACCLDHDGTPNLPFALAGGIDITTAYFHRGMNMGDTGLILQPFVTLSLDDIRLGDDAWVRPYVGNWNSLQEGRRGHGIAPPNSSTSATQGRVIEQTPGAPRGPFPMHYTGDPRHDNDFTGQLNEFFGGSVSDNPRAGWGWYEAELYGGALFGLGPATIDLKYSDHMFPGGDVDSYQEVSGRFALEVAQWLPESRVTPRSLRPYAELAYQVAGSDGHHAYLELGIEPTWVISLGRKDMGISMPVLAGLNVDGYYRDLYGDEVALGYWSIGVKASWRFATDTALGDLYLNAAVTYLRLESDLLVLANDGRQDAVVGTVGISFAK